MKKAGVVVATAASVVLALLTAGVASADGETDAEWARVDIMSQAFWEGDIQVNVGVRVECKTASGTGQLEVQVTQLPPESTVKTTGDGMKTVICDGQGRDVSVDITADFGFQFDIGKAEADATLLSASAAMQQPTDMIVAQQLDRGIFLNLR